MKTSIVTIHPAAAQRILDRKNPNNLPLQENLVAKIARDITNGVFVTTHQGIAFDEEGQLLDGQHRLAACVRSGRPITVLMTKGLQSKYRMNGTTINTFELIDSGRIRKVGHMLARLGYKNCNNVAAAVRAAIIFASKGTRNLSLSTPQAHAAIEKLKGHLEPIIDIGAGHRGIMRPPSWMLGILAFYHSVEPQKAEEFLQSVCDVTGKAGSASRAFSTWISRKKTHGGASAIEFIPVATNAIMINHHDGTASKIYANQESMEWLRDLNKPLAKSLANLVRDAVN